MPQSTDAILCYGFQVGEEDEPPEWLKVPDDEFDPLTDSDTLEFAEFVARLHEIEEPGSQWEDQRPQVMEAYWQAKRDAVKQEGVDIVHHCHSEYTMRILAATASVKVAPRGLPVELGETLSCFGHGASGWRQALRAFCERAGSPFEEPQWILCSYWSA